MKKIQLADGMPNSIELKNQSDSVKKLVDNIKKVCLESGENYVNQNKALYLADKELYMEKINS